jgi:hypothetical protein
MLVSISCATSCSNAAPSRASDDDRLHPPARCEPEPDLGDRRRPPELCVASQRPSHKKHNVVLSLSSFRLA